MRRATLWMGFVVLVFQAVQTGVTLADTITLTATDYGMLRQKVPNGNYIQDDLSVWQAGADSSEPTYARDGVIKFDLSGITVPAGQAITSAKLQFYGRSEWSSEMPDSSGFSQTAALIDQQTITGMTWNNTHGALPTFTYTMLDSLGYVTTSGYPSGWNDSSLASAADINKLDAIRTSTNASAAFILLNGTGGVQYDPSDDSAHGGWNENLPRLIVTVSQVPEPTALYLVTSGALGLSAYAWRKRR